MDDGKSNVAQDGTGCTLLDNEGAYCPDVPSLLLRRRFCAECRITFDVAAPGESREGSAIALFGCCRHRDKSIKLTQAPLFKS